MSIDKLRIVFGTMTLGDQVSEANSKELLNYFFNQTKQDTYSELDTALMYSEGKTEQILGRQLTLEQRDRLYIATKANPIVAGGLQPENVIKQLETSLNRLQMKSVNLFYLHAPDHKVDIKDTLQAVQKCYEKGWFKELGISNYASWQVADIWHICKNNGWVLPTVYQGMYNGITRQVEHELFPCLRRFGIKFYIYNPLAGGLLTGKYTKTTDTAHKGTRFDGKKMYQDRYWKQSYFDAVNTIREAIDAHNNDTKENITMTEAALRWCVHHSKCDGKQGDAIIIGQSSLEHLKSNIEGCRKAELPQSIVEAYDKGWKLCKADVASYLR